MARKPAHQQFDTEKTVRERAFRLFGRHGYDGVSIGDIAAAAQLSKSALYWHYDGKDALYLDCLKRLHGLFDQYIFDPMRAQADPAQSVLTMFRGLERVVSDPRVQDGVSGYWLASAAAARDEFAAEQQAFERRAMQTIADTLHRGVAQGLFDLGGDLEDFARAVMLLVSVAILPLRHAGVSESHRLLGVLARTVFRAYAKDVNLPPF